MSARKPTLAKTQLEHYDRLMLRSALVSLFWAVIADRKKSHSYKLQDLADAIGMDKSGVSRWFSGNDPNWTLNTVADIANALNVDLRVEAVDRDTRTVYTSQGRQTEPRDPGNAIEADDGKSALRAQPLKQNVKASSSRGKQVHAQSQPARARNEDKLRARHPRKPRQHKGSRVP